jgi:2-alkenal reductase
MAHMQNGEPLDRPNRRATDGLDWQPDPARGGDPPPFPVAVRPVRRWPLVIVALLAGLVGGAAAGGLVAVIVRDGSNSPVTAGGGTSPLAPTRVTVEQTSAALEAVERARPAVVKIESTRMVSGRREQDVGSGVVVDREGHIVTNAHVVLGTETLEVVLSDGSRRPAILVGHDYPFTDVAVLQVGPVPMAPIAIGDAGQLALGETVLAIGNPLAEFQGTVTAGIVSGLNRSRTLDAVRQDGLIQTDAPVNSGNSGGALVNLRGEFVGMPTFVLRVQRTGGPAVEGIAFALPAARVMAVANEIIATRASIRRPSLGATHIDLDPASPPRGIQLAANEGALLTAVDREGPAASAGLVPGDIVTQVGGTVVDAATPLLNALAAFSPGEAVRVVLNRGGRIIETQVRLGSRS